MRKCVTHPRQRLGLEPRKYILFVGRLEPENNPHVLVEAFSRIGSVKAPKQVDIWPDLPRSKVGKVLKKEIRARLLAGQGRD